jgi:hypothetical protein
LGGLSPPDLEKKIHAELWKLSAHIEISLFVILTSKNFGALNQAHLIEDYTPLVKGSKGAKTCTIIVQCCMMVYCLNIQGWAKVSNSFNNSKNIHSKIMKPSSQVFGNIAQFLT